jgi:6-methylsalicylate decarboxylase
MTPAGRIDTHHHVVPPTYAAWLKEKGIAAVGLPIPDWSLDAAISLMDKFRIQTSIMSISTPGVHLGDDKEAREKAREVNEICRGRRTEAPLSFRILRHAMPARG